MWVLGKMFVFLWVLASICPLKPELYVSVSVKLGPGSLSPCSSHASAESMTPVSSNFRLQARYSKWSGLIQYLWSGNVFLKEVCLGHWGWTLRAVNRGGRRQLEKGLGSGCSGHKCLRQAASRASLRCFPTDESLFPIRLSKLFFSCCAP